MYSCCALYGISQEPRPDASSCRGNLQYVLVFTVTLPLTDTISLACCETGLYMAFNYYRNSP